MKSAMRKLISLCVLAMLAISPLAMAQDGPTETTIKAVMATSATPADAYATLTGEDSPLSEAQKEALIALGLDAGIAFLNAIEGGSSLAAAALIATTAADGEGDTGNLTQLASAFSFDPASGETAAGPGTGAGVTGGNGGPSAPGAGSGGTGGGNGGGNTGSNN
ncbi:hypothetical protein D210916BOD24_19270 [Alteromonas sp. D210916BOD_24]|uniref:hypothetical protein n=1 Tax=Alteromonas sp. D210916BOD_24 TaxID=3157618 RepID=UPI00399C6600